MRCKPEQKGIIGNLQVDCVASVHHNIVLSLLQSTHILRVDIIFSHRFIHNLLSILLKKEKNTQEISRDVEFNYRNKYIANGLWRHAPLQDQEFFYFLKETKNQPT